MKTRAYQMNSYDEVTEQYANWLETLGYCNGFVSDCKYQALLFFDWFEDRKKYAVLNLLTDKDINDYLQYLEIRPNKFNKDRLLSVASINQMILAINKLLEFLRSYGMETAPFPQCKRLKVDYQERIDNINVLTQDEVKTLYNTINDCYQELPFAEQLAKQYELKLILTLYYGCGLRCSEGYNLTVDDVDFNKRTVFVRQGKNYKDRIIPMSNGVYDELHNYIYGYRCTQKAKHNRLFLCCKGAISLKLKHLQSCCEDETIKSKRVHLHLLRHSIATHLLHNGMEIENIALFLGHRSLDSTQIYTHLVG